MIAVYVITVLIKLSAELESHNNSFVVFFYLNHFFSASFKFQVGLLVRLKQYVDHIACSCLHCFKLFKDMSVHCCVRYAIIIIIILSCSYV